MAKRPTQSDDSRPVLVLASGSEGRRQFLHDEIYSVLRKALENGEFAPGRSFSMRWLAERFGTSLIPVRDALKRLVAEGALQLLPNRTVCVPLMTRARFQELLSVRLYLEPMLTRRATEIIDYATVSELEAINNDMQLGARSGDIHRYLSKNSAFHFKLYSQTDSEVALPIVKNLWGQVGPFLNAVFNQAGTSAAKDHHGEILRALRRRDALAAGEAICRDLGEAADLILARSNFVLDAQVGSAKPGAAAPEQDDESIEKANRSSLHQGP
ncbi:MAG TPA: GntR family transcriptional regulator [Pseudolabrys sp.]|nr:GntR family transcriptional regulator [Pseudolabrys sp.]